MLVQSFLNRIGYTGPSRVDLETLYGIHLGLGRGPLLPYPLEERQWSEDGFQFRLERLDDRWWRFHNHDGWPSHNFTEEPRDLSWFQGQCTRLQIDSQSLFVNLAIVIRKTKDGFDLLADTRLYRASNNMETKEQLQTIEEYARVLTTLLDQDLGAEVQTLWANATERTRIKAQTEEKNS
jgi:N-hydroxyarylamine O-acetyltransferase